MLYNYLKYLNICSNRNTFCKGKNINNKNRIENHFIFFKNSLLAYTILIISLLGRLARLLTFPHRMSLVWSSSCKYINFDIFNTCAFSL